MSRMLLAIGLVISLAAQVLGEGPEARNDVVDRIGVFGTLGYTDYTMGNESQYINQDLAGSQSFGTLGGIMGGLGMTYGVSDFCQVGFEFEGLSGETNGTIKPGENAAISLPALEFGALIKLILPVENWWFYSCGLGLYNLWIDYDNENFTFTDGTARSSTFYGSTLATKLWVGGEYFFTNHLSLGIDIGYRFALVNDVADESGAIWLNSDGSKLTMNYGGPFARAVFQYYF